MHELVPFFRRTERRGWERLSAESPPPPPLHLSHTFFPGMGECVCGIGELAYILPRSLIPSLFPSLPPSDDSLLYEFIHLSPLHLIFVTLLLFFSTFILSPRVFLSLSLSHTVLSHSFFFFFFCVTAKEEKMSSRRAGRGEDGEKRRGSRGESFVQLRKRETDAAPAESQRTALVLPVRVMDRPGKSSPCENKTPKRRKDPHQTGQLLKENQSILVFFFISGPGAQNYLSYKLVQSIFRP